MEAIRADVLAVKGRAKAQRCDTLAKNALFIEFVRRWEAGLAAGEGTKDLKRRLDSLEARNTELDEECDNLSRRGEMSKRPCSPSGNSVMTKGELTARRKTTECGRHTLLTKSGGWQKAATREFEAKTKKSGTWSYGRSPMRGLGSTSSSHKCARNIREPTPRTSPLWRWRSEYSPARPAC
jgi:hypothetical protein